MRWWGLAGLVAGSLLTASACSGDDDAASPGPASTAAATTMESTTTEPPATTTTTTTTVESTTTTTESTTAAPEPTAPPTTSPSPENVPPRVTFPDDPEKQAVVDAGYAFFDAARAAQAAPDDDRRRVSLAVQMTDPIATTLNDFLDGLASNGERVIEGPEHATYLDIVPPTVIATDGAATFDACSVDGDIRVDVEGDIVGSNVGSAFLTYSFSRHGGDWRLSDVTVYSRYPGVIGCEEP